MRGYKWGEGGKRCNLKIYRLTSRSIILNKILKYRKRRRE